MKAWKLLALLPASLLAACGSTERVRYKMTVEVETPEGTKTGFAVRESRYETPPSIPALGEDRGKVVLFGEAVAVDLPDGQILFALLSSANRDTDYGARIPDRLMGFRPGGELSPGPVTVWPPAHREGMPMLVRFRDIADSRTVEPVRPEALSAAFGPGVRLRRIIVQATTEPVTTGLASRLNWLLPYPEDASLGEYSLPTTNPTFAQRLGHGDFRKGKPE